MKPKQRSPFFLFCTFLSVFIIDEFLKSAILTDVLEIPPNKNYGAMLGIPFDPAYTLFFLLVFAALISRIRKDADFSSDMTFSSLLGLVFGGMASNVFDRIFRGFVVDYITITGYLSFNLSDIAIVFGTSMLFLKIIRK